MKYCIQGFLLIEIMVALTIFTMVSMMLAHHYWQASALQQDARRYVEATQLASRTLQEVANNKQIISSKTVGNYNISCAVELASFGGHGRMNGGVKDFRVVKVTVFWSGSQGEKKKIMLGSGEVL